MHCVLCIVHLAHDNHTINAAVAAVVRYGCAYAASLPVIFGPRNAIAEQHRGQNARLLWLPHVPAGHMTKEQAHQGE